MGIVIVVGTVDNVDILLETVHLVIVRPSLPDVGLGPAEKTMSSCG
jgi:hypothetical protein